MKIFICGWWQNEQLILKHVLSGKQLAEESSRTFVIAENIFQYFMGF